MNYASENNIILDLNEKSGNGRYPLLHATMNNNTEIVSLLMDYAQKNNTVLSLKEKKRSL